MVDGVLDDGEELWQRRLQEAQRSAEILGVQRVEFLGYHDSGMMGTPENDLPHTFWQADVEEAAERLAQILREEARRHPHDLRQRRQLRPPRPHPGAPRGPARRRAGRHPARLRGHDEPRPLQAVDARGGGARRPPGRRSRPIPEFFDTLGRPESVITTTSTSGSTSSTKREAMRAHASQIADTSFFLSMSDEAFEQGFGYEWFIRHGVPERPPRRRPLRRSRMTEAWTHTALAQQLVFGAGSLRSPARAGEGARRAQGAARHHRGPAGLARRRSGWRSS